MISIKEIFQDLFKSPPLITENSTLHEIAVHHPNLHSFVERKYGIKIDILDNTLSLKEFTEKHALPPSQILFMEIQLEERNKQVNEVPAVELKKNISKYKILDAREDWEKKRGKLPSSLDFDSSLLDKILKEWPKETPIIIYCHFGVRSLDAAHFLADHGFTQVSILKGGIDSWSKEIDPSIPRYEGAYC